MRILATLAMFVVLIPMMGPQGVRPKATQTVTVTTDANRQAENIPYAYVTLMMDCVHRVATQADPTETIAACKKVVDAADAFDPDTHFLTRRGAYVYYAAALMQGKRYQDAQAAGDKAVSVVLLGHDDDSGSSAAYQARGSAKAEAHDLAGADKDFETAEAYERKALAAATKLASPFLTGKYTKTLKGLLTYQAQILVGMGDQDAADSKLAEANKL
jgi:tetratricopeptide (TPR) repeat protein